MVSAATETVAVRGGKFRSKVWSKGSGSPLLFLHGGGGLPDWPAWLDPFAEKYRVIAPQHPGFGESSGLEHLDDFVDLALYYLDLMEELRLERPAVIGHSFGGAIAAEAAALGPERVGKLVLAGALGLWSDEEPVADFFSMTRSELEMAAWHDVEGALARGLIVEPKDERERQQFQLEQAQSFAAMGKFIWPIPDKGLKKRIHRIKAPTLIVWGASDRLVPPVYGRLYQERIPGSRLVVIPEAGHRPMLEQPAAFRDAVLGFLKG